MPLMRRLGVDLSSSESSEGSIGPGYENVVALSSSLSHIESLSADGSVSLFLILWFHNPCKASPAEGVGSL